MSWKKLKSKVTQQDLDAEFEKFLNESLSDESASSPRRSITPKGARSKAKLLSSTTGKFEKPWWATSDDEEKSGFSDVVKQMWIKKKGSEEVAASANNNGTKTSDVLSKDSLEVTASRPGTALDTIMSEPEEYSASFEKSEGNSNVKKNTSSEDSQSVSHFDETEETSPKVKGSTHMVGKTVNKDDIDLMATLPPGMETLDEMKDKEAFFDNLEKNANESIDYGALNKQFDKEEGLIDKDDDQYAHVGLQLYEQNYSSDNSESNGSPENKKSSSESIDVEPQKNTSRKSSLSKDSSQSRTRKDSSSSRDSSQSRTRKDSSSSSDTNNSSKKKLSDQDSSKTSKSNASFSKHSANVIAESSRHDNGNSAPVTVSPLKKPNLGQVKSASMPANIALLEKLESTYGNNLTEKLTKLRKYERKTLNTDGSSSSAPFIGGSSSHLNLGLTEEGTMQSSQLLVDTGKTTADLTKVLQDVKELSSRSLDQFSPPHVEASQPNIEVPQVEDVHQPVPSNMLVLDKHAQNEIQYNEHDRQPATQSLNKDIENSIIKSVYQAEFGLKEQSPVQRYKIIQEEINEAIKDELEKVIQEKKEANEFTLEQMERSNDAVNDYSHGFDLQPIEAIMKDSYEETHVQEEVSFNKRTPIVSKEKAKQMKQIEKNSKTSSKHHVNLMTSKSKETPSYLRATINSSQRSKIPRYKQDEEHTSTNLKKWQSKRLYQINDSQTKKRPTKEKFSRRSKDEENPIDATQHQLIESMQNMTSYLKQLANQGSPNPLSKSVHLSRDIHIDTLTREQSLQEELKELRILYETECREHNQLKVEHHAQQQQWKIKYNELKESKDLIIRKLNDDMDVLNKKLQLSNEDVAKSDFNKINEPSMNEDNSIVKLNEQLSQQEILLNGYQQENERLYNQLKKYETDKKKYEVQLLKENKKLASENANLKEELETIGCREVQPGSAEFAAKQLTQLKNQVKFYQTRDTEYKEEIMNLEGEISALKRTISLHDKQKGALTSKDHHAEIERLKAAHAVEIDKLTKRLKWYGENQQLIDQDTSELASQRKEITKLRELIDRLEEENNKLRKNEKEKKDERNNSDKRILDLQRQVKEMEDIIRRRHPNSLPALIFAASSVPNEVRSYETSNQNESKHKQLHLFLEKKIKQLENELENKDVDNSKKVRSIEQNFSQISLRYEEHIKQLEHKINELSLKLKSSKSIDELGKEVQRNKVNDDVLTNNKDLDAKNAQINKLKLDVLEGKKKNRRADNVEENSVLSLQNDIAKLREKLREKESELKQCRLTINLLQKDREDILSKKNINIPKGGDFDRNVHEAFEKELFAKDSHIKEIIITKLNLEKMISHLEGENKQLKTLVEQLKIEAEEGRLKIEGAHASIMNEKRKLKEDHEEEVKQLKVTYEMKIEKLRIDYVLQHSNSKVAELSGKLKSYELIIEHMKGSLEEAKMDRKKVEKLKESESYLEEKIKRLEGELHESRSLQNPEVFHYRALQSKILALESRHMEKEKELEKIMNSVKMKASVDMDQLEDKWREILRSKDDEIQEFRTELDSMLEVLQELKRQGVMIPTKDNFYY